MKPAVKVREKRSEGWNIVGPKSRAPANITRSFDLFLGVSNTGPCSQFSCDGKILCGAKLQQ
ncbi:hypothetical protein NQ315_002845 [Exocentrus adspersus]|uniref:Uncharacterized protein n=1 Tax=Exocentrus adspersus TaxID=1586481 RepID=A0AAV8V5X9_9CUCU|nr:hypothetical protein NQ315_002845 [Exocentrus adspersus]